MSFPGWSQNAASVLNQAPFVRDRCGEEQRVQRWAVEALADIGTCGDDQQRLSAGLNVEPGEGGSPCFCPHAAAQYHRITALLAECGGKEFEMLGPLRQYEAVPPTAQGNDDVVDNLLRASGIGHQVAIDSG